MIGDERVRIQGRIPATYCGIKTGHYGRSSPKGVIFPHASAEYPLLRISIMLLKPSDPSAFGRGCFATALAIIAKTYTIQRDVLVIQDW